MFYQPAIYLQNVLVVCTLVVYVCVVNSFQCLFFTGRSYVVTTQRSLIMCIESLVQKCQSGVVINFEKIGPDPNPMEGMTLFQ